MHSYAKNEVAVRANAIQLQSRSRGQKEASSGSHSRQTSRNGKS